MKTQLKETELGKLARMWGGSALAEYEKLLATNAAALEFATHLDKRLDGDANGRVRVVKTYKELPPQLQLEAIITAMERCQSMSNTEYLAQWEEMVKGFFGSHALKFRMSYRTAIAQASRFGKKRLRERIIEAYDGDEEKASSLLERHAKLNFSAKVQ